MIDGITALNSGRNCIENGYPFVESILNKLPMVDRSLVSDGGSTDGTWEVLQRLADEFPKIEVFQWPDIKNVRWDSNTVNSNKFIKMSDTSWIYLDNMDEMFHETDLISIRDALLIEEVADVFRFDRKEVTHNWSKLTADIYLPGRAARKSNTLYMNWNAYGGDEFLDYTGWIKDHPKCQLLEGFILYHFHAVFPSNYINKRRNDVEWIAPGDTWRMKIWEQIKNNTYDHIQLPDPSNVYYGLPKISKDLSQMRKYRVREELFDKSWLEEVTGFVY